MLFAISLLAFTPSLSFSSATVDITPPENLPLGGYTDRQGKVSEPGGSPLYERVTVLKAGDLKIAVVSLEMLTVPDSLFREVNKRIPKDVHLLLAATHTHSAPDSQMLNDRMTLSIPGIASYKRQWLQWYADKIASGVNSALRELAQPSASLKVEQWNAEVNRGRRRFAEPDTAATLVSLGGKPVWFSYAAHATLFNAKRNQTSGDWPGKVAERGLSVFVGAIGDVSPFADGRNPEEQIQYMDRNLFIHRESRIASAWSGPSLPVTWITQSIPLGAKVAHPDFAKKYGIPDPLAQSIVKQFAPDAAQITAFRLGKLAVVGVPGEPTSHLGRQIRDAGRRIGFKTVLVLSHVNGWMGYILGPADYDRGGYEATLSFYGRDEGSAVVASAVAALKELARQQK